MHKKTYGWINVMKTTIDPVEQWRHVVHLVLVMVHCWCEKMALNGYIELMIMTIYVNLPKTLLALNH